MISASSGIHSVSKISEALFELYPKADQQRKIVADVERLQEFFRKEEQVFGFLTDHFVNRESKLAVFEELRQSGLDAYLVNSLCFMVDIGLIFHLKIFLSTLRTRLHKALNIRSIFVYSPFEISPEQKKKIEELWKGRFPQSTCEFLYAIDQSLKLGIKVQVGDYVEEFTAKSNLSLVELKLDSLFV